MNPTELSEAIKQLSNELHALIGASVTVQGIPAVQQELIKSKCVALYDLLLKMETASDAAIPAIPVIPVAPPPPVEVKEKPVVPEPVRPAPQPVVEAPVVPPPSLFNDLPVAEVEEEEPVTEEKTKPVVPPVMEKTKTELQNEIIDEIIEIREEQKHREKSNLPPPSKETLSEISLHEKIASVLPNADLTDRFSTSLSSLKAAINVNLKIALVNDLFNENTVEYVKAIDKLNNSADINEAMRFFTELKHAYGWDNDDVLVKELESLVQKRFS